MEKKAKCVKIRIRVDTLSEAWRTFLISYVSFSTEIVSPYYLHPERRPSGGVKIPVEIGVLRLCGGLLDRTLDKFKLNFYD